MRTPLRTDIAAAAAVGALAAVFASVVAAGLGLLGRHVAGVHVGPPSLLATLVAACVGGIVLARALGTRLPPLYDFAKFAEVGGLNWLFDLGVLNLLMLATGVTAGLGFAAFKSISFASSATNSYLWNTHWVFRGHERPDARREVRKFAVATALGLLVNVAIAAALAYLGPRLIGGLQPKVWANAGAVAGSAGAMLFNFALYRIWVFTAR